MLRHRVVNQKHILVGVSGGVRADPWKTAATDAIRTDEKGVLAKDRVYHGDAPTAAERWWWD
ncbi:MAG: hypothetical protein QM811_21795 [Pirellulales bacterium]